MSFDTYHSKMGHHNHQQMQRQHQQILSRSQSSKRCERVAGTCGPAGEGDCDKFRKKKRTKKLRPPNSIQSKTTITQSIRYPRGSNWSENNNTSSLFNDKRWCLGLLAVLTLVSLTSAQEFELNKYIAKEDRRRAIGVGSVWLSDCGNANLIKNSTIATTSIKNDAFPNNKSSQVIHNQNGSGNVQSTPHDEVMLTSSNNLQTFLAMAPLETLAKQLDQQQPVQTLEPPVTLAPTIVTTSASHQQIVDQIIRPAESSNLSGLKLGESQVAPVSTSPWLPVEPMVAADSKKKKMMKKKKKMEKKHKEWKKGKKHKKKKYESKKKKGGMSKKKKGKKEKKKWGMEKKGHKKKGNFKKKKWGKKKKMKKGQKKGKKGHKMLKDKGHKKKGFKKVYHKEEWGKKKKWHDIKREKKWNTKQKKWKKKWHQEKGKKYKGKHMKKYHKKNKHGKKYKKEKKSKWKKHKGEKFKKGHKKKKEEYSKKKEGGKKKKMKKMKKEMKKKKKG